MEWNLVKEAKKISKEVKEYQERTDAVLEIIEALPFNIGVRFDPGAWNTLDGDYTRVSLIYYRGRTHLTKEAQLFNKWEVEHWRQFTNNVVHNFVDEIQNENLKGKTTRI